MGKKERFSCLLPTYKYINRIKVKGQKNIYHVNLSQKKGKMTVLLDKMDFRAKNVTRDKEGDIIGIKGQFIKSI